ncbi:17687_t:CDS:1, partial [Racocetra persica]
FELQMYTVDKDGDPSDERLSYRKLSEPTICKFTWKSKLFENIEHKHILRWSVAVSDKSTSSPEFRLLAISCINVKVLESFKQIIDKTHTKKETNDHGLTFVFMIKNFESKNSGYSIAPIDNKELPIEYGGIVELFSEKDNSISSQNDEKDNDGYFLIILTLSGVYKYHIKNKS